MLNLNKIFKLKFMSKKQNKKTEKNEEIHQIAKDFINQFKAVQIYS